MDSAKIERTYTDPNFWNQKWENNDLMWHKNTKHELF